MDDQPLPSRGSYNYNFDDFDENTNPFESKKGSLANSPPRNVGFHDAMISQTPERETDDGSCRTGEECSPPSGSGDLDINENTPKKTPQSRIKKPSPRKDGRSGSKLVKPVQRRSPSSDPEIDIPALRSAPANPEPSEPSEPSVPSVPSDEPKSFSLVCDATDLSPIGDVTGDFPAADVRTEFPAGDVRGGGDVGGAFPGETGTGVPEINDDEFKPATDVFNDAASLDMLENFGGGGKEPSNLARESLYVRFDPLLKKNSPMVPVPHSKVEETIPEAEESVAPPAGVNGDDDLLMMHTPPASHVTKPRAHPAARQLQKRLVQPRTDELDKIFEVQEQPGPLRSLFCPMFGFGSKPQSESGSDENEIEAEFPAPTRDPAPSLVNATPTVPNEGGIVEVLKYSDSDLSKFKMEQQAKLLSKERDWNAREKELLAEIQGHKDTIEKMTLSNEDMQKIVAEYERTVSQVIVDKAKLTSTTEENLSDAIRERNQAVDQLRTMETAFSDLHGRYEKAKGAVETLKANEEELKKCISDYQNKIKKHEQRYQLLKQHAEEKLQSANEEIDKVHKTKNADIARIQAALKRSELQVSSLEKSLQQKVQENQELTSICDDLIKQVGGDG